MVLYLFGIPILTPFSLFEKNPYTPQDVNITPISTTPTEGVTPSTTSNILTNNNNALANNNNALSEVSDIVKFAVIGLGLFALIKVMK